MSKEKVVLTGPFEDVIEKDKHLYITHKLDTLCVIPYTIADNGILDKVGVIKEDNLYKLLTGYISADDATDLVAANRILFEVIQSNVKGADNWMYLGKLTNISGGDITLYSVNIGDVPVKTSTESEDQEQALKFEMIKSNEVVASDDALFLAAYLRLFNYFYVNSLKT
jgi:hypothetical protein